jgi:nitrate reductase NapAB chaperone NapD
MAFFLSPTAAPDLGEVRMRRDRRDFLRGSWGSGGPAETATILVQVRPERLDSVAHAVGAIDGIVIRSRDPRGRLTVAIDATAIGPTLSALGDLPDVLSTNLLNMSAGSSGPEVRA